MLSIKWLRDPMYNSDLRNLYRAFIWDGKNSGHKSGPYSPLFVSRENQGKGRHDIIDKDGILYCSYDKCSVIAEILAPFSNRSIGSDVVKRLFDNINSTTAIAHFNIARDVNIANLTRASSLTKLKLNPADIATMNRTTTQAISRRIFDLKTMYTGFSWWSSIESQWTNVSLFQSRLNKSIKISKIELIDIHSNYFQKAIDTLRIVLKNG